MFAGGEGLHLVVGGGDAPAPLGAGPPHHLPLRIADTQGVWPSLDWGGGGQGHPGRRVSCIIILITIIRSLRSWGRIG